MGHTTGRAVQTLLDQADWDRLLPKLLIYADTRLAAQHWPGGHPPGGPDGEDLVHEAIGSLYEGERQWNPSEHPDIEIVLKGIIKSKISHLVTSGDNQTRQALSEKPGVNGWGYEANSPQPSPEDDLRAKELFARLEGAFEGDEDAGMVLLCLQEGFTRPGEIAEQLGKPVSDVYRILRRIRSRLKSTEP